ncbi:TetR family transcriptional regulator [Streptomyces geysiriensis]|nr:TetR family transcriptional regulator [Streptomyces geysiriensis]
MAADLRRLEGLAAAGRKESPDAVVSMAGRTVRTEQVSATRQLILTTAERLFAEHGVYAVSNRQVSEAAGQGNNAAVGYHFGTKADLVRAIAQRHSLRVEELRARQLAGLGDSTDLRDWVDCLVRPQFDHLAALGSPTWYARFCAQVMTDPALRQIMVDESRASASLQEIVAGRDRCMPALPAEVRAERGDMARHLIVHTAAERERALAEGRPTPRASWQEAADGLVDAIVAMWLAPVTARPRA